VRGVLASRAILGAIVLIRRGERDARPVTAVSADVSEVKECA
jgi:hypothetical protein